MSNENIFLEVNKEAAVMRNEFPILFGQLIIINENNTSNFLKKFIVKLDLNLAIYQVSGHHCGKKGTISM